MSKVPPRWCSSAPRLEHELAELERVADSWAADGLKVLAIAERRLPDASLDDDAVECDLELVGVVALHDPLRVGTRGYSRRLLPPACGWRWSPVTIL